MRLKYLTGLLVGVALISQVTGCGSSDGPSLGIVTGKITMNDEPLAGVSVTFTPKQKGSPSYGVTDESGDYRLLFNQNREGAEVGGHNVVFEFPEPETDDSGKRIGPKQAVQIPPKYRQPNGVPAEVVAGRNTLDFNLDGKK